MIVERAGKPPGIANRAMNEQEGVVATCGPGMRAWHRATSSIRVRGDGCVVLN